MLLLYREGALHIHSNRDKHLLNTNMYSPVGQDSVVYNNILLPQPVQILQVTLFSTLGELLPSGVYINEVVVAGAVNLSTETNVFTSYKRNTPSSVRGT